MTAKPRPKPTPAKAALERSIYLIRAQKVMLDADLAALYGVETKVLNQAVKRNLERFPEDFMFQLSEEENEFLISQFVMSNAVPLLRSQIVTSKRKITDSSKENRGGRRNLPYAFTEQGIAMLSSVLKSKRAIEMNIHIIRTFVKLREMLAAHKDLAARMEKLETRQDKQGAVLGLLVEEISAMKKAPAPKKRGIGFLAKMD